MADSVINCNSNTQAIMDAFKILYSVEFNNILKNIQNPYGNGGASKKIKDTIKKVSLENILKKSFYDIKVQNDWL